MHSLATLHEIIHDGWACARKTVHSSSPTRSVLLFRAHPSYQSLGTLGRSTDISLNKEPRKGRDTWPRQFQHVAQTPGSTARPATSSRSDYIQDTETGPWSEDFSRVSCSVSCTQNSVFLLFSWTQRAFSLTPAHAETRLIPACLSSSRPSAHFGAC